MMRVEPTTLITEPQNVEPNFPDPVTFTMKATSDPDTAVTYTWYRYDKDWTVIHHVANKTHIMMTNNGSSLTIYNTGVADLGRYKCVATNGVDQVTSEVQLLTPPDLGNFTLLTSCDRDDLKLSADLPLAVNVCFLRPCLDSRKLGQLKRN